MSTQETFRPTFPTVPDPPYPRLTYGLPFDQACAKHVKETFRAARPYIIASNTLSKKTDNLERLQTALGSGLAGTWIGIPNHTPIDSLLPIMDDMRAKQADCLITLGGGSLSDGAKLITFALANHTSTIEDIMKLPRVGDDGKTPTDFSPWKAPTIPVICIPISLSGGEYSCWAGVTDLKTHFKYQFHHPKIFPSLMILDSHLTRGTPLSTWISSGVRCIDHCVEGYLSANSNPEGDESAVEALPALVNGLLRTKQEPDDLDSRLSCQLGSNLSMTLLYLGVKKGASHGVGHQLGPLGVAHGETSCVMLPAVCKYNADVNGDKQRNLVDLLCRQEPVQAVLRGAGIPSDQADLGDILRAIFNALGVPKSLKDVGVGEDKLDSLAEGCLKEVYVISNPKPLKTKEDVRSLLEMVLE